MALACLLIQDLVGFLLNTFSIKRSSKTFDHCFLEFLQLCKSEKTEPDGLKWKGNMRLMAVPPGALAECCVLKNYPTTRSGIHVIP